MEIGLVGLGPMGLGIGTSLLRELAPQVHCIAVYNRSAEKAAPLVEKEKPARQRAEPSRRSPAASAVEEVSGQA